MIRKGNASSSQKSLSRTPGKKSAKPVSAPNSRIKHVNAEREVVTEVNSNERAIDVENNTIAAMPRIDETYEIGDLMITHL